ncbi:MAG TPA: group 1 truncated hemoglobin [Saprospiraceae bacterium]|nr:group 1 truncated hemoglobin [Saprospiraceae bacterium]HPI08013.1 group 1 truncated hemoglobin [Saprospiraceae bacterium]
MLNYLKILLIAGVAAICSFGACNKEKAEEPPQTQTTLFERLGGIDTISALVDQFIVNIAGDEIINTRFAPTISDPARARLFRLNLIDQICAGSGGPCTYKGLTMKAAHKEMNITQAEFDALVGDLVSALDQLNVGEIEKKELLRILGPMQAEIVSR